jgi:hypothetical protein
MLGSDGIIKCLGWSSNRLAKMEISSSMLGAGGIIKCLGWYIIRLAEMEFQYAWFRWHYQMLRLVY